MGMAETGVIWMAARATQHAWVAHDCTLASGEWRTMCQRAEMKEGQRVSGEKVLKMQQI